MNIQFKNIRFLLETQAELSLFPQFLLKATALETEARDKRVTDDNIDAAKDLPAYVTNSGTTDFMRTPARSGMAKSFVTTGSSGAPICPVVPRPSMVIRSYSTPFLEIFSTDTPGNSKSTMIWRIC